MKKIIKNKVILYVGSYADKKEVVLYNFQDITHVSTLGRSYVRVNCDGRYYHFPTMETIISSIIIY